VNFKFSNPGGAVSGEQGVACIMGEGDLGSGPCNELPVPLSNCGNRFRSESISTSVRSDASTEHAFSINPTAIALVGAKSCNTYVVSAMG